LLERADPRRGEELNRRREDYKGGPPIIGHYSLESPMDASADTAPASRHPATESP
jgi:hypothetical protein